MLFQPRRIGSSTPLHYSEATKTLRDDAVASPWVCCWRFLRSRKQIGQLGFLETDLVPARSAVADRLSRIDGLIDWSGLSPALDDLYRSRRGEPAYPPLPMFKVLLLRRWYALVGPTPDHTTIHRFRDRRARGGRLRRPRLSLRASASPSRRSRHRRRHHAARHQGGARSGRARERNKRLINPRRPVEKLFGTLKRGYRFERMPHFSMAHNVTTNDKQRKDLQGEEAQNAVSKGLCSTLFNTALALTACKTRRPNS